MRWLPSRRDHGSSSSRNLEIRKRHGLMITMLVLIVLPVVLFYAFRLLFHAVDPHTYDRVRLKPGRRRR
jgi:hypothetical protein